VIRAKVTLIVAELHARLRQLGFADAEVTSITAAAERDAVAVAMHGDP